MNGREERRRSSAHEQSSGHQSQRSASNPTEKLKKMLRFGASNSEKVEPVSTKNTQKLNSSNPQSSQTTQKEAPNPQKRMSKLLAMNAFAAPPKKIAPSIQEEFIKPTRPNQTFYPTRVPGEQYFEEADKKGIHKYFELFKKMDCDSATEYVGIMNKKINHGDYSDVNLLVRQIGRRITSKSGNSSANNNKKVENKEKSVLEELGIKKFEPYLEDVSIEKLKGKAEFLKEEIQNVALTVKTGRFRSKLQPPKTVKSLYELEQEETTTKINRLDPVERLSSLKKPIYANLIRSDDQRRLLALSLINTELQIYSLVPFEQTVRFVEVFKHNIESLIIDLVFGYNETWEADYLAVLVQDKIIFYRLSKGPEGDYRPSGLFSVAQHTLSDPIKLVICKGFPLVLVGNKGTLQYFEESQEVRYELSGEFEARWEKTTMAITTCVVSERNKIIAIGNAGGHVANIDGLSKQMKCTFNKFQDLVLDLHTLDEQNQLLVVFKSKRIAVLDIFTLALLQLIRDEEIHKPHDRFTTSFFDKQNGLIIIGGSYLKGYKAIIDEEIELNKRETQIQDKFRVKSNIHISLPLPDQTTKQLHDDTFTRYDPLRVRALLKVFHLERQNHILAIEQSKVAKIYDPSSLSIIFSFVIKIEGELITAEISRNDKVLVVANDSGLVKMIYLSSGEEFESFFSTKMAISVMRILPENSPAAVICADSEGKLCFYYSKFRGKGEQRPHQFVLAHSKPVCAMDCSDEFLVTADEGNMVIMWTFTSFIPISNMLLPTHNPGSEGNLSTFNEYRSPIKKGSVHATNILADQSNKPYPVEVVGFKQQNHLFMVLQSNGSLHLIRTTDNTLVHTFKNPVGNFAHINLDYFDTSLLTVDEKHVIRIFQIINEAPSPTPSISEDVRDQNSPNLSLIQTKSMMSRRKTTTLHTKKDTEEGDDEEAMSPTRKTRFSKIPDRSAIRPSALDGGLQPIPLLQASVSSNVTGVLRRRGVYAAGKILKIGEPISDKNQLTEWSLTLVQQTDLRDIYKSNFEKLKCVKVVYTKYFSGFMTAFNYGDILLWNRKGKLKKRIKNVDCIKDANLDDVTSSDNSDD